MTKKELIRHIKDCYQVLATTRLTQHDMYYVRVYKDDLLKQVRPQPKDTVFEATRQKGYLILG